MTEGVGKHAGARRADPVQPAKPQGRGTLLALALGTTLCIVAWGYLVWAAIDFGRTARAGETSSWTYLGIASVGAIACLFAGLLLVVRLLKLLRAGSTEPVVAATPGGRRAKR